jgi:hypothetical protein
MTGRPWVAIRPRTHKGDRDQARDGRHAQAEDAAVEAHGAEKRGTKVTKRASKRFKEIFTKRL